MNDLAEVRLSTGRFYLSVAGYVVAVEGDKCREGELPDALYDPIPDEELETATIGGQKVKGMDPAIVRVFRGSRWNRGMLEYVAAEINRKAANHAPLEQGTSKDTGRTGEGA